MPNVLSFDTATNACSVALVVGKQVYTRHEIAPRRHATLLLPIVDLLLNEAGVSRNSLDAIAFGCGPGSFMGARLAVGMAQGLAFGLSIPVIPISTLQTLAQTAYQKTGCDHVLVGWDARMGDVYWGRYALNKDGVMCALQEDALSAPGAIRVNSMPDSLCVAGNAWDVYADALSSELLAVLKTNLVNCYPDAQAMLPIACNRLDSGEAVEPVLANPSYLRDKVTN